MKARFTFLLVLIAFTTTQAQSWAPIGAKWHYELIYAFWPGSSYNTATVTSDTVINGITCSRIDWLTYSCNIRPQIEYMYQDSGRVYFWESTLNDFVRLYDFNLQTDDTLDIYTVIQSQTTPPFDTVRFVIDSIYNVVLNGQTRKVQLVQNLRFPTLNAIEYRFEIIEGIGSTYQMFPWNGPACDDQFNYGLRCYSDSTFGFYNFTGQPCDQVITSIEDQFSNDFQLRVSSNPVSNRVYWNYSEAFLENFNAQTMAEVTILNPQGQNVKKAQTQDRQIDVTGLSNGIYFLEIKLSGHHFLEEFLILN